MFTVDLSPANKARPRKSDNALTKRQSGILGVIRQSIQERGWAPTVKEIGEAVGLSSTSTVHSHLESLQKKGFLRRNPHKPRALELMDNPGRPSYEQMRLRLAALEAVAEAARRVAHLHPELAASLAELDGEQVVADAA